MQTILFTIILNKVLNIHDNCSRISLKIEKGNLTEISNNICCKQVTEFEKWWLIIITKAMNAETWIALKKRVEKNMEILILIIYWHLQTLFFVVVVWTPSIFFIIFEICGAIFNNTTSSKSFTVRHIESNFLKWAT